MSNHHADNQFRNPLEDISSQVTTDLARDLSSAISRDLSQHPEDALALMRAMSSSKDMPAGFASASDLFGNGGGGNCGTNDYSNCWSPAENYKLDSSTYNPRYENERASISHDSNKGGKFSDIENIANVVTSGIGDVTSGIGDVVNPRHDNSDDGDGGGSVWKTVGSIAMDVLPFLL